VRWLSIILVVTGAWLGTPAAARAQSESAGRSAEARRHFEAGTRLYAKGQLVEALSEFEQANAIKPDPSLLYDLAQTHRGLGHDRSALTFYRAFLEAAPYAPNREEVIGKIKVLEEELARRDAEQKRLESTMAAATARANEADEAKRVAQELAAIAAQQAQRAGEAQHAAVEAQLRAERMLKHKSPPLYKRWWLWTVVGAVVAGGIVTTAVLSAPKPPSTNQGSFAF
jgi:tetratricopeptide (TPR) repeat protein